MVLAIAFVDELVAMLAGGTPQYIAGEADEAARAMQARGES